MKLTVSHFQIHKSATVDIPEGETTYLEGDSDTGKSAMLRAIRWLCENKPDGGSFVTFKTPRGTNSVAKLEIDGHVITRERGKSKNTYTLDGEVYEAFGRSVPEPILKVLNLSPYAFQLQGEAPFLIGASPTEAAKILSEACGLGMIDTAVGFVRARKTAAEADIRKSEILLESAERRLAEAGAQLPLADALDRIAAAGEAVEAQERRCAAMSDALDAEPHGEPIDLAAAKGRAAAARLARDEAGVLLPLVSKMQGVLSAEPKGVPVDLTAARRSAGRLHLLRGDVEELARITGRAEAMLRAEPKGATVDLTGAKGRLARTRTLGERIRDVRGSLARIEQLLAAEPKGEPVDLTELKNQRAAVKVCPTCGREL